MKLLLNIFLVIFLITVSSCHVPKLVEKINDAKKLEINNDKFVGKPLKDVITQIRPQIKFVYGNPENNSGDVTGGTYFSFYFVEKDEGKRRVSANDIPTNITIQFQLEHKNHRKSLPKDGLKEWTKKETKEYGDMIIMSIRVRGKD